MAKIDYYINNVKVKTFPLQDNKITTSWKIGPAPNNDIILPSNYNFQNTHIRITKKNNNQFTICAYPKATVIYNNTLLPEQIEIDLPDNMKFYLDAKQKSYIIFDSEKNIDEARQRQQKRLAQLDQHIIGTASTDTIMSQADDMIAFKDSSYIIDTSNSDIIIDEDQSNTFEQKTKQTSTIPKILSVENATTPSQKQYTRAMQAMPQMQGKQKTALKEGDMILERYRVQKLLGKGGMGIVYQVFDCSLNYSVAFKMLFIQQDISQQELEVAFQRFQLEARSMAQIKHPNVLAIHDIGEYLGMPYYTMDLINGKELSEYTGVDIFEREMVTIQQIMEWAYTLCTAIQYVHDQGIIHRDLKPSNVMITEDRGPILMDFGIARIENYKADLTVEGQSLGTPAYMAPEQALGRKKEINNRTDVYGIGAILYETLTGTAPYSGNPMQVMFKVISPTNFPIPIKERNEKVTSDVITIVEKAMSKEQSARYKSAGEMAEDIKRYLDGYRIYAKPPTRLEKCKYYFKHRAKSTIITASLLLIIFFVSIFLFIKQTQEEKERKEKIASLSKQATEQLMVLQDLDNTQNIEARNRSSESKKYLPIFFDIIRLYDEILRLNPNNLAIKQARLNIFLQLGEYTTQIKNFEVASSIYNSAIEYANQNNLRTVNLDQLREECNSLTMRHETETNKQLGLIFQKIDQLATTSTNKNNETNKEKKE